MKKMEYAVVDIETTGGSAGGSRITEIAVLIHNGKEVIERWETLVNPQQHIPLYITALTGISNEMVYEAPLFQDIAKKLLQLLSNRIFVAHNVNFDYSFVRHQLEDAGYKWTAPKLCTVRAARKIKPGLPSYSLGNLCRSLGISLENRHRAGGDADATAVLLSLLINDGALEIQKMIKKTAPDQRLPPNLPPEDFENLPEKPGVYYFYNAQKKVVYVGKAVNLKKRVASHFSGHKITPQRQHFLRDIHGISFEVCATELMALLLECSEIKKLWPIYNTALKRFEPKYGLYEYTARNSYRYFAVGKVSKLMPCIEVFSTINEGISLLRNLQEQFELDYRFCKYAVNTESENVVVNNLSDLPLVEKHNQQVQQAVNFVTELKPSYYILDKGRTKNEQSCIWVQDGHFYGMGYISNEAVLTDVEELKDFLTRYKSNSYIMQLISAFAVKYPQKVTQIT
ncbi:exonuclease domain-containing protein [Paenimyroides ummariense]|nr:exonuclease domain-containing protein [Paenimyroides ummariense]